MAAPAPLLRIAVVTLFPELIEAASRYGITGRALEMALWRLWCVNPREFATDNHRTVDDRPYGGGPGMVMLAGPLEQALDAAAARIGADGGSAKPKVVYLTPQGERLAHERVLALKEDGDLVLLAGRYEGIDERLLERRVDLELSLGDYVLSGGEFPALVLIDALVRQLPGATNDPDSIREESFADGLLDCPHYTRPEVHGGAAVPPVLLSGNHALIRRWRLKQALGRTWLRRPDLLSGRRMSDEEARLLQEFKRESSLE
ncbi:MAG: tRNA (guanosine(37)-N1)-methyltransferase TrmD [Betaproteobacteria bacterium]|nr:tRNA (guanosine(37)-N1)-methyltransferase TrmD [Betaproteobacteria bacterium]